MSEDNMVSDAGFSLAELAGFDTTEIAIIKSRLPEAGNYTWQIQKTVLSMLPASEGKAPLPQVKYELGIAEFEPIVADPERDYTTMIGKVMRDTVTIWTNDIKESLGLLRGRYAKVGLNSEGKMGGVEGLPPGWLDEANGSFIKGRVRHYESKGETRAAIDWTAAVDLGEGAES